MTQLNVRFDIVSVMAYDGLVIVPVKVLPLYHKKIDCRQKFRLFAEFYRSDLRCCKTLEAKLDLWEVYWLNDASCHPDNSSSTIKNIDFKCSVILRYASEFLEHYLWLHELARDDFPPWGGWKPTLAVHWYQKDWIE